jgi:predicted HTH transcriptional regulator
MQVWWPTSVSRKQDEMHSQEFIQKDEPDNDDVLDKIQIENVYNLRKWCIQKYRSEITNPVEKRIAEVYFDDKKQTAKEMAEFFNVSRTSAHYMIRDLKQKIRKIQYSYERI